MSFFKKLFGQEDKQPEPAKRPGPDGTEMDKLEALLKPLLKPVTRIKTTKADFPDYNTQLKSHFGGHPYFNEGEAWPATKDGRPLEFVMQVFSQPGFALPGNIKLVQFYYDFEEFPFETESDGWLIKIYGNDDWSNIKYIEKPEGQNNCNYCEVVFENGVSLPGLETISNQYRDIDEMLHIVNPDEPWEVYEYFTKKLTANGLGGNQLGGYPYWIQNDETPTDEAGNQLQLLLQVDSDDDAGLMWGDAGLLYFYYNTQTRKVDYIMQCC